MTNLHHTLDIECYRDYFLCLIKNVETGDVYGWEMYPGKPLEVTALPALKYITFNGLNYDFPILSLALAGCDNATLKRASDDIIINQLKPWDIQGMYGGVDLSGVDHIDLFNVAPGQAGLKAYGGRLHSKKLQDLPIDPAASISAEDRATLRDYCNNDCQVTIDLYRKLKPQIELREAMSSEFGIDLRSKSDAQIAEAVIRSEIEKRVGYRVYRPDIHPAYKFRYRTPPWIAYRSPGLRQMLAIVADMKFTLDANGAVEMPRVLESLRMRIGNGVYRMGVGGLHSSEESISHFAGDHTLLVDRDVTSYYPSIILLQGLYPTHLGRDFLDVYRMLVERRIEAKHAGNKVMADALKICVNGSFGKLGSKWSVLYSPDLMVQVTMTGQLALLMLIEIIETAGIPVISANTDGVVIKCPSSRKDDLDLLVASWEIASGFVTEETQYQSLHFKDVNNYIAIKPDGSTKLKGLYATEGLQKNNTNSVCVEAAITALLGRDSRLVENTIYGETDPRKFVTIRQVKGGGTYDGQYLGKVVRWYMAFGETRHISYATNGNKVAKSDGARPLMELPDELPSDIDYAWYIEEARSILADVGM